MINSKGNAIIRLAHLWVVLLKVEKFINMLPGKLKKSGAEFTKNQGNSPIFLSYHCGSWSYFIGYTLSIMLFKFFALSTHQLRWLECAILFGLLPLIMYLFREQLSTLILPMVTLISIVCVTLLYRDKRFKRFRLTNHTGFKLNIKRVFLFFSLLVLISFLIYVLFFQLPPFNFVLNGTSSWLMLILLYPIFSALPQELIFRTFLFHRYKRIIPNKHHRMLLSSFCFGLAHLMYGNLVAVGLSMAAGYCFCITYAVSRSTLLVALEHSLWGVWIFTLGLGSYFSLTPLA